MIRDYSAGANTSITITDSKILIPNIRTNKIELPNKINKNNLEAGHRGRRNHSSRFLSTRW